eukprot:TRINITY_DN7797_c0_g1_i1.p1 TRINITY_DN7797_c0_g1~~TRINITY_DN7797_c0_g1_i1.p1  ORF type:complete len:304 (+),score=99.11 TRINITY_DN7797_c0_g1_i1:68-913(+)
MSAEEIAALKEENERLNEQVKQMNMQMIGLRFASNTPDLDDAYDRRKAAVEVESPEIGTRVKIVNQGSKYNSNDFKSSFGEGLDYTDVVEQGAMGVVTQKCQHFKKRGTEVFLVKFDSGKSAVLARKGIEPSFWVGSHVTITNVGCKYAAKDFSSRYPDNTVTDECRVSQRGVIISIQPHYKAKNTTVFLVAIDSKLRCVVMNGKGCTPREIPGLRDYSRRRERKEEERAKKEKEAEEKTTTEEQSPAAEEEPVAGQESEKRAASEEPEDAPSEKKRKVEE